jgi:hypothetical protein
VPQKFNYQGIARDAKGNPLAHQRMTLKLTLLPTSDATEGEYEEIQTVMTNEFGLYTLQIGNGASTSLSTFKDIKWETGNKYIRVAIDPKGGSDFVDAGTNQLLSVPYAIYADKAGMAKNAGGDRTGTVSTNATHVSGDTNFLAKFTGLNVIGKSQLFDNGTNVGVGTTSPLFKLHIQKPTGNADILVRTLDSTGAASLRLRNSAGAELGINKFGPNATGNFMGIPRANMAAVNNFTTGPFVFNSGSDIVFGNTVGPTQIPRMFVSGATGNVGIGTLTPSAKLEVAGQLKITGGNPAVGKILTSDSNGLASWQTSITDSQWASNGTHIFNNNSVNVGIGTNTPSSQLHLASPIAEIRLQNTAINTSLFITAPFNGGTGGIGTDGNHELPFFTNNIERLVIKNDGKVGIGTSTPNASALMHLSSTNKGVIFPQVSIDSLKDITSIANPANGLIVYNTTQPGVLNDMTRGYYWYSTNALSWVKLADNLVDNKWQDGGVLGVQLKDKTDGVEIMDNYIGSATNLSPKVKILKMLDSSALNSKNNITALVLSGINKKPTAGWENRQKTSIIFENGYQNSDGSSSGIQNSCAISAYTESTGTTSSNQTNGLAFYTTTSPANTAVADTPTLSMFRHNVMIGGFATDINNVTEGRLQITGFNNGDQLSLRHPSSSVLKWGFYVSSIDSSLNFYYNGSLRANIDRVTGVYAALSDRRYKKDIIPLSPVLAKVKNLKAYNYRYLDSEETDRKVNGFMAQDLLTDFPELVYQRYDRTKDKPLYTVDYSGFGVIAIKAIQEQQELLDRQNSKIESLEKQNLELKTQNDLIIKRLEVLEKK